MTFGSLASTTPTAMVPLMLAALGMPLKVVLGYVSTARVLVALEQGEIDAVFTVSDSFARRQDLIANRIVVPIFQSKPVVPDLPVVRDVLPPEQGPLLTLVMGTDNFGLPLVGPPGIPAEQTEILRKAFVDMVADKDYQADAVKADLPVGAPLEGAQLAAMINELATSATPEIDRGLSAPGGGEVGRLRRRDAAHFTPSPRARGEGRMRGPCRNPSLSKRPSPADSFSALPCRPLPARGARNARPCQAPAETY